MECVRNFISRWNEKKEKKRKDGLEYINGKKVALYYDYIHFKEIYEYIPAYWYLENCTDLNQPKKILYAFDSEMLPVVVFISNGIESLPDVAQVKPELISYFSKIVGVAIRNRESSPGDFAVIESVDRLGKVTYSGPDEATAFQTANPYLH